MTKRELIDEIMDINQTAGPDFLAEFADIELDEYLKHLQEARKPRPVKYSRQGRAMIETPSFHDALDTPTEEFSPNRSMLDSTNPFENVALTVTDYPPEEHRGKTSQEQTGFRHPSKVLAYQSYKSQNDDQARLF